MDTAHNKDAAIWARISGPEQQSLPSQVAEVKEWLESQGFTVLLERILMVDWTSTDILRCPQMQMLLRWVTNHEVAAVGSLHLDRFAARPGQVAQILDTFRQSGVELLLKQTPLPTGLMGELMGLVITIGKALSVERADKGATKGLHDRPKLHHVPVIYRKPYGYRWETTPRRLPPGEKIRLLPDDEHGFVHFMCREGLAGTTLGSIRRNLKERHILSPTGEEEWCIQTITNIFHNPLYGGRFYALRRQAVEPRNRQSDNTYGKSSQQWLPFETWVYLPEVEVVNPPLTWDEWLALQKRLEQNQLLAKRNATHDYLLRGVLICDLHNRRYRGRPSHGSYRYVCPAKGEHGPYFPGWFNGPDIERGVKEMITNQMIVEAIWRKGHPDTTEDSVKKELARLGMTERRTNNALVELERRNLGTDLVDEQDRIAPQVYRQLKLQLEAKLQWTMERREQLNEQLYNLQRQAEAVARLNDIHERVQDKLAGFTTAEWRNLFLELGLNIHIGDDFFPEVRFDLPLAAQPAAARIVSSMP